VPERILIRDLKANQFLDGVFAIQNCQLGQTKNGKPFIKCLLADRSAKVPGRMWNVTEELFSTLPTDGFVFIEGSTQPYQGQMQIIIGQIRAVTPKPHELEDLLPCSPFDRDEMFAEVRLILSSLSDPGIKALAQVYLSDEELMARFLRAPAAVNMHHAYLSGLLEHTLSLLRLGQAFTALYPQLNRDIVLMGLFLHDLGKCYELAWDTGFTYTDDGQLIGHIARGAIMLQRKAEDCRALGHKLTGPVLLVLQHIILSHHGQPEFGAAKLPSTPEAIAISILDNLDAKMHMALAVSRGPAGDAKAAELGGNFTEKLWALDTRLYKPDPTTVVE
jgi:3'-5' exoribonuclease